MQAAVFFGLGGSSWWWLSFRPIAAIHERLLSAESGHSQKRGIAAFASLHNIARSELGMVRATLPKPACLPTG